MSDTTNIEIAGPPRVDTSYMGRPIRVPLNRVPDHTWQLRLSLAPPSERIRYIEVDGSSLLVFPAPGWEKREDAVLDTVVHVIDRTNHTYFQDRRAREDAEDRAQRAREQIESEREEKLVGWWESRQGG
jgi:hypothetical protein